MQDTKIEPVERSTASWKRALARVMRIIGWTSIVAGLLVLGFVVQQLYVTTWFAQQHQEVLSEEVLDHFADVEITEVEYAQPPSDGASDGAGASTDPDRGKLVVEGIPDEGTAFIVLRIPKIERLREGWAVVEGVRVRDLKNGAGHMPNTPLPGQPGNSVISGHRTTYGQPFHELDALIPGDKIEVDSATGTHIYEVREWIVVRPTDVWVTETREGAWLTLTTCHPKNSSRRRLIVFAEMVDGPNYDTIYA